MILLFGQLSKDRELIITPSERSIKIRLFPNRYNRGNYSSNFMVRRKSNGTLAIW